MPGPAAQPQHSGNCDGPHKAATGPSNAGDDGGDWQKASSSHSAARKKKRKQQRRSAMAPAAEASERMPACTATVATQQATAPAASDSALELGKHAAAETRRTGAVQTTPAVAVVSDIPAVDSEAVANTDCGIIIGRQAAQNMTHQEMAAQADGSQSNTAEAAVVQAVQAASGSTAASSQGELEKDGTAASSQAELETAEPEVEATGSSDAIPSDSISVSSQSDLAKDAAEDASAAQSSVASVTADFAMQNVILQMGLRLVAPNGMLIKQLSRWVLRCSACFKITKVGCASSCLPACNAGSAWLHLTAPALPGAALLRRYSPVLAAGKQCTVVNKYAAAVL